MLCFSVVPTHSFLWTLSGLFQPRNSCDSFLGIITWSSPCFCFLFLSVTPITYPFHSSQPACAFFSLSLFYFPCFFYILSPFWKIPNVTIQIYWVFNFCDTNFYFKELLNFVLFDFLWFFITPSCYFSCMQYFLFYFLRYLIVEFL